MFAPHLLDWLASVHIGCAPVPKCILEGPLSSSAMVKPFGILTKRGVSTGTWGYAKTKSIFWVLHLQSNIRMCQKQLLHGVKIITLSTPNSLSWEAWHHNNISRENKYYSVHVTSSKHSQKSRWEEEILLLVLSKNLCVPESTIHSRVQCQGRQNTKVEFIVQSCSKECIGRWHL